MSKEASFWYDTDPDYKGYGQLKDKIETDVVIIGAGITGTSSAYHLAKKGIKTVVLDKKFVGSGATGKSTGFVELGNEEDLSVATKHYPDSFVKKLWDSSRYSIESLKDTINEEKIDCDFINSGWLLTASKPQHIEQLKAEASARKRFGYHAEMLSAKEVSEKVNMFNQFGALHTPDEKSLNPVKLVRGLARAAVREKAEIYENSGVQKISFDDNKVVLKTDNGEVTAKTLVIATDAYTRELGFLREKIIPFYDHVLATEPLTDSQLSTIGWKNRELLNDSYRYYHYIRLSPDDRVMIGNSESWAEGGKVADTVHKREHDKLHKQLLTYFPQLEGISVTHKWVGCLGYTPDFLPLIGRSSKDPKSPVYSVGFNGHGIALGFLSGKILSDLYTAGNSYYADVYSVERKHKAHDFRAKINNLRIPDKVKFGLINMHLQASRFMERNF